MAKRVLGNFTLIKFDTRFFTRFININILRPYWRCYYSNTDAIIYVVDSMDRDRIGISKTELFAMLEV